MIPLQRYGLAAAAGSAALLAGAFAFQHIGGLAPCPMCVWQRWPHALAILLGAALLALPRRPIALAGALAMLVGAGIGFYHAGVELHLWTGPTTCVAPDVAGISPEDLLASILDAPVVRCDEVSWSLFGISMAGWNALLSLALSGVWLKAYASSSASQ